MRTRVARVAGSAAAMGVSWSLMLLAFEHLIIPDGWIRPSPIMMFQGAWSSHLATDHAAAWWLVNTFDGAEVWLVFVLLAVVAERVSSARATLVTRLLTWCAFAGAYLAVLSVPVAAIGAFHHCGHSLPCNPQNGASMLTLLAVAGIPAVALRAWCDACPAIRDS